MTDTDLLPDRLKYFWADDEEGPYQGPFSSRELATSDAYTYRAKCFDDPSQDDGFFMMATHGLLVDAEDGPWRVLAIDVTDQFHDAWNTRASTPSSTRANERGDLEFNELMEKFPKLGTNIEWLANNIGNVSMVDWANFLSVLQDTLNKALSHDNAELGKVGEIFDKLTQYAEDSIGYQYETLSAALVEKLAKEGLAIIDRLMGVKG